MKAMKVICWALGTGKLSTKTEFCEHILLQPKKNFLSGLVVLIPFKIL